MVQKKKQLKADPWFLFPFLFVSLILRMLFNWKLRLTIGTWYCMRDIELTLTLCYGTIFLHFFSFCFLNDCEWRKNGIEISSNAMMWCYNKNEEKKSHKSLASYTLLSSWKYDFFICWFQWICSSNPMNWR